MPTVACKVKQPSDAFLVCVCCVFFFSLLLCTVNDDATTDLVKLSQRTVGNILVWMVVKNKVPSHPLTSSSFHHLVLHRLVLHRLVLHRVPPRSQQAGKLTLQSLLPSMLWMDEENVGMMPIALVQLCGDDNTAQFGFSEGCGGHPGYQGIYFSSSFITR